MGSTTPNLHYIYLTYITGSVACPFDGLDPPLLGETWGKQGKGIDWTGPADHSFLLHIHYSPPPVIPLELCGAFLITPQLHNNKVHSHNHSSPRPVRRSLHLVCLVLVAPH